ncbi:MAG TPA: hypothetical protein VL527_11280 [Dongiaceae bacterium]|nr:hypothetical protein [Dongiaceae bacterium]
MRLPRKSMLLALLAVTLVGGLAWVVPGPPRPAVAISLLGYTNDASGVSLAIIAVTNHSSFPVFVYAPTLQLQAPEASQGFTPYFGGNTNQWQRFHELLARGEGGSFMIPPPPKNPPPWRLRFFAYSDFGAVQTLRRYLHGRRLPFIVTSDWIEEKSRLPAARAQQ